MKSKDLVISSETFIGIVLFYGIAFLLSYLDSVLGFLYLIAVFIAGLFLMILNAKKKEKR